MERHRYDIDHRLSDAAENIHHTWNNSIKPVSTIRSGDIVRFQCPEASNGAVDERTGVADVPDVSLDPGHALIGPVAIEEATPGDVLEVELLDVHHGGWGWTAHWPDKGLLADHFTEHGLHIWKLDEGIGYFDGGIEVPLDPSPGTIGVAPAVNGSHSTIPPRNVGGNLDVKYLTEGSTAYFPVDVDTALFSVGDGHAAQGDGEVCLTGIETPLTLTARFSVHSQMQIERPRYATETRTTDGTAYATTGISDDLMTATEQAIRGMIEYLVSQWNLPRSQAYMLCSVVVDLKTNQVVNRPNWTVSAHIPESIFPK